MTTLVLAVVLVILFFIGLVSPHAAGKIQSKADREAHWLKKLSNWLWDPVTWWAKSSIEWSRKAIDLAAGLGKKGHKKAKVKK